MGLFRLPCLSRVRVIDECKKSYFTDETKETKKIKNLVHQNRKKCDDSVIEKTKIPDITSVGVFCIGCRFLWLLRLVGESSKVKDSKKMRERGSGDGNFSNFSSYQQRQQERRNILV